MWLCDTNNGWHWWQGRRGLTILELQSRIFKVCFTGVRSSHRNEKKWWLVTFQLAVAVFCVLVLHGSLNRRMAGFLHILTHLFGEEKLCHSVNLWQQFFCQSISGYVFFNKTKKWQLLHCTNIGFLFRWSIRAIVGTTTVTTSQQQ